MRVLAQPREPIGSTPARQENFLGSITRARYYKNGQIGM